MDASLLFAVDVAGEVAIRDIGAEDGPHRGLNDFWIIAGDGVSAADDVTDAEPVGGAENGAEIAGVLQAVESKCNLVGFVGRCDRGSFYEHPNFVGCAQAAEP